MSQDKPRNCKRGKVWELHIHSNQCFSADDELKKLPIPDYVSSLLDVLTDYEDLEMISFTDHNQINIDLYREFINRNSGIALLPGIEIDACLIPHGGKRDSKHIIAYFDAVDNMEQLEPIAAAINGFMIEHHVGVQKKDERPIYIHELLDMLVSLNVQFVLSPHSMKQGKRDIDADWHAMEDAERKGEMKKYLDQFFCFWEASGTNQIHHATSFLNEMDCGERLSIVAFSDSKDLDKLRRYLEEPCQYFNALPNFNGLKMAGSEITRITHEQFFIERTDLGKYIGSVQFGDQTIEFAPRLNAIIGGRGSGKSVLLDSIANYIGLPNERLDGGRIDFISAYPIAMTSMSGGVIEPGQFHYDYYNQSYIAKLFQKHGDEFNAELESYFNFAFENVEQIGVAQIRRENEESFESRLTEVQTRSLANLEGFVERYVVDHGDTLSISILDKNKKKVDPKLAGFDYSATRTALDKVLQQKIPVFLRDDEAVAEAISSLYAVIYSRAYDARLKYLAGDFLFNAITDNFKQKKASISKAQKDRSDAIDLFRATFDDKCLGYCKRVAIVNALIGACEGFQTHYEKVYETRGEKEKAFLFKRELDIEHPLDFMVRMFVAQMTTIRDIKQCSLSNLWTYIQQFCFHEDCYKQGFSSETLYKALTAYTLKYKERSAIYYMMDNGTYVDISKLSPGTQTNILIEYIVNQDTDIPLLIDQPEDNVDNQTIYSKIRGWFMKLKATRQVIVVTHDANIVINADADNIILAKQEPGGTFCYDWGALEYGDMLEDASLILDGGKEAVKRRLVKYGE